MTLKTSRHSRSESTRPFIPYYGTNDTLEMSRGIGAFPFDYEDERTLKKTHKNAMRKWKKLYSAATTVRDRANETLVSRLLPFFSNNPGNGWLSQKSDRSTIKEAVRHVSYVLSNEQPFFPAVRAAVKQLESSLVEDPSANTENPKNLYREFDQLVNVVVEPLHTLCQKIEAVKPPEEWINGVCGSSGGGQWPTTTEHCLPAYAARAAEFADKFFRSDTDQYLADLTKCAGVSGTDYAYIPATRKETKEDARGESALEEDWEDVDENHTTDRASSCKSCGSCETATKKQSGEGTAKVREERKPLWADFANDATSLRSDLDELSRKVVTALKTKVPVSVETMRTGFGIYGEGMRQTGPPTSLPMSMAA